MKKIAIFAFICIGLATTSCKKKYTCECVTTDIDSSGNSIDVYTYPSTTSAYDKKMSEKQAKAACSHEQEAIHSSYNNWWTENGTNTDPDFVTTTACTLK